MSFDFRVLVFKICLLFHYLIGAVAITGDTFGENSLPFVLGGVNCSGSERGLQDCPRIQASGASCSAYQDAGVVCQGTACGVQCTSMLIHLWRVSCGLI